MRLGNAGRRRAGRAPRGSAHERRSVGASRSDATCNALAQELAWDRTKAGLRWRATARLHDLRHTYASILASEGLSLPIIGALLGHTQPQTTARYAHLLDDPLRAATERVGVMITANSKTGLVQPTNR